MKFPILITLIFLFVWGNIGTNSIDTGIAQNSASTKQQAASGYISMTSNCCQLYLLQDDGSGVAKLLDLENAPTDLYAILDVVWSPDGSRAALKVDAKGCICIYLMNADGSNLSKLTQGPSDGEPAWSPDGKNMAFSRRQGHRDEGPEFESQIYVISADGARLDRLTTSFGRNDEPQWSPNGKHIAYISNLSPQDPTQINIMEADGSNPTQLTDGEFDNDWPRWSPDGKQIAFQSARDGRWQIYVMNMDGTRQTNLSKSKFDDITPKWSPDGNSVAFSRWQKFSEQDAKSLGIYVVRVDKSGTTSIEKRDSRDYVLTYQAYDFAWSPDSKRMVLALADMIHADSLYIADMSCLSSKEGCSSVPVTDFIAKYNLYDKLDHGIGNSVSWFLRKN